MLKPKPLSHSLYLHDSLVLLQPSLCMRCHFLYTQRRHVCTSTTTTTKPPQGPASPPAPTAANGAPKPSQKPLGDVRDHKSSKREVDHTPKPLAHPIGMPLPPQPGENTGVDNRSYRQRRDDFVNYEKHLERRQQMCVHLSSLIDLHLRKPARLNNLVPI
jgi:mitochondrial ATPase complex subunit ATP10